MNFHEVFDLYFAVMNLLGFFYFLLEINMNLKNNYNVKSSLKIINKVNIS